MSILVKGMEMPMCCGDCLYRKKINPEENQCFLTGKVFDETFSILTERRYADCPLVPCKDVVEVVRCKNCRWRTEADSAWHPCTDMQTQDYWFCGDGEAK